METKSFRQEIDILEVLAKIVDQIRRHLLLAILLPLFGAVTGYLWSRFTPTTISSNMMMVTDQLSEEQCNFLLMQFETSQPLPLIDSLHKDNVSAISHEIIRPYRYFVDDRSVHVQISAVVTEAHYLPLLQRSILDFLESSTIANNRKKSMRDYDEKVIEGIDRELASIDDIEKNVSGKDQLNSVNAANLHLESVTLLEKKLKLQNNIASGKVFKVVEGFKNKIYKTKSPVLSIFVGMGLGLLGLFIALALLYFLHYYRNYKNTSA